MTLQEKVDTILGSKLCPRCCHLANSTRHNVVFHSASLARLCEDVTSSTKPEIHNVLHCRQRRTEPPTTTVNKYRKFRKVGSCWGMRLWRCANGQADKQTDTKNTYIHADSNNRGRSKTHGYAPACNGQPYMTMVHCLKCLLYQS